MLGDRRPLARIVLAALLLLLTGMMIWSLGSGASDYDFTSVLAVIFGRGTHAVGLVEHTVIMDVRLPRTLMGALVGAALAISGALMQGMFRNPLADPGIVGVSAGASLGAASVIILGPGILGPLAPLLGIYHVPVAAFTGALASTFLLYAIATRQGRTSVATMLLAGIALASIANAATGILIYLADDQQLRSLTFWSLGSLAAATWPKVISIAPVILPLLLLVPLMAKGLNALMLGETMAVTMGVNVQRFKAVLIVTVAAATGAAVAVTGGIGFIGLVAPHVLRLVIGPDHKWLLPCSALLGGVLLLAADIIARQIVAPAELPIGIVTALMGGPFFLWLILRNRTLMDI